MFLLMFLLQIELIRRDYVANGGWETFLSYEDPEQDILFTLIITHSFVVTFSSAVTSQRALRHKRFFARGPV